MFKNIVKIPENMAKIAKNCLNFQGLYMSHFRIFWKINSIDPLSMSYLEFLFLRWPNHPNAHSILYQHVNQKPYILKKLSKMFALLFSTTNILPKFQTSEYNTSWNSSASYYSHAYAFVFESKVLKRKPCIIKWNCIKF